MDAGRIYFRPYYDCQLRNTRRKFGDQVLTFNLCYCPGQLAPFPVATCRPLTSLAAKRIVTIGNEESCPWHHRNSKSKNFVTKAPSRLTRLIIVVRDSNSLCEVVGNIFCSKHYTLKDARIIISVVSIVKRHKARTKRHKARKDDYEKVRQTLPSL